MRISDWSSDVCSSELDAPAFDADAVTLVAHPRADVLERQHVFARAVAAGRSHLQPVAIQSQPRGVAIDAARIKQVQVVRHPVHRIHEARADERREGKEYDSQRGSSWAADHKKK